MQILLKGENADKCASKLSLDRCLEGILEKLDIRCKKETVVKSFKILSVIRARSFEVFITFLL